MSPTTRKESRLSRFAWSAAVSTLAAIIFSATLFSVWIIGPEVETRYAPAVSKLYIESVDTASDPAHALVRASFTKLRNCEYIGIGWFRASENGTLERVALELRPEHNDDENSPNRPVGYQRAGPWEIYMPADEIVGRSIVRLWHRCHPFWVTLTEFYP